MDRHDRTIVGLRMSDTSYLLKNNIPNVQAHLGSENIQDSLRLAALPKIERSLVQTPLHQVNIANMITLLQVRLHT